MYFISKVIENEEQEPVKEDNIFVRVTKIDESKGNKGDYIYLISELVHLGWYNYVIVDIDDFDKEFLVTGEELFNHRDDVIGITECDDETFGLHIISKQEWLLGTVLEYEGIRNLTTDEHKRYLSYIVKLFKRFLISLHADYEYKDGYICRCFPVYPGYPVITQICLSQVYIHWWLRICDDLKIEDDIVTVPISEKTCMKLRVVNKSLFSKILLGIRG